MFKKIREVTHLLFLSTWIILVGCIAKGRVDISLLSPNKQSLLNLNVAQVKVQNNQLIITGTNLTNVTQVKLVNSGITQIFSVESVSSTQLIANGISAVSIGVGKVFDMILSNASAAATVPVTFTLNNKSVTGVMLSNMSAQSGEVLTFNGTDWGPSSPIIPQLYKGTWDPTIPGSIPNVGTAGTGDYWIISKGGVYAGNGVTYAAGDWIIEEDGFWVKIPMSTNSVTSYNGNKGIVVTLPSDYILLKNGSGKLPGSSLNDLANVDLTTTAPVNGNVLKYNGVAWVPGTAGGAAGAIGSTEITDLSITGADIAENTINPSKIYSSSIDAALYLRGDKTWANFAADTLNVPLSTYSLNATVKPVVGITDKIGAALGKIQKFLNDLDTDYVSKTATSQVVSGTFSFTSPTSFLYTQLPSGVSPTEVANVQYVQNYVSNAVTGGSSYAPTTLTITSSTISAASTILPVVSTTDYPPTGTLLVGSEVVSYTGKTATSFTGLTRGLYGTTASGIPDSLPVNNYLSLARSSTSVTPKMVVTGSGNVGIGTTAPTTALEVTGNITLTNGANRTISMKSVGNTSGNNLTVSSGAVTTGTGNGGTLLINSGSTSQDGNGGNINITSGNGGSVSGVGGNVNILAGDSISGDGPSGGAVNIAGGRSSFQPGGPVNITGGAPFFGNGNGGAVVINGGAKIGTGVNGDVILANSRGNVGIGSTAPLTKLEVTGENSTSYISNKVAGFAPTFAGYRANGTQASPTSPAVADNLVGLVGYGYVSGNYIDGGGVFVSRDSGV